MENVQSNVKSFADKADSIRRQAAESLDAAAESVRCAGNESAGAIRDMAKEAGKKLETTASTVRNFEVLGGLRDKVRRYPVRSLAVAVSVGVVAGFCTRSSR